MPRFRLDEEKENLFSLYQSIHSSLLNNIVGSKIDELEQEVPFKGKKIDICGWADKINQNLFVEVQLIPADMRHMDMVKTIISNINKGIIVWEALTFAKREHLIEEVVEFIKSQKKPVNVLFAVVNPEVIPVLEQLSMLYPLNVIPNLGRLSQVKEPLKIIARYNGKGNGEKHQGLWQQNICKPFQLEPESLSTRLGSNLYLIKKIRKDMWYYPPVYRAKSRLDTNAIVYGAGNGNIYEISIRDAYSHLKLRIPRKNSDTFKELKTRKENIENVIGYAVNFREKISSFILDIPILTFGRPRTEVLDEIVQLFERFVRYFTSFFDEKEKERKVVSF
ncbi:hypothetical protein Desaci_2072 [Desulfosporosinus acidiphilus SJ4]|uniref:Uncharacterized protein n=1 Tax=Desulfosporosinus acidiphilus (strain DSM 22704 / JCM 16185 / SJ4) TaxID=646529 RepID=I4D5H1_DESAJ|nr:hypothetical protein [Desulfosporosinus acidiphilus]AFM41045.1 hypothetical protein Desaci_2072 [Desulfosporosinus acidiphilus SJ4]